MVRKSQTVVASKPLRPLLSIDSSLRQRARHVCLLVRVDLWWVERAINRQSQERVGGGCRGRVVDFAGGQDRVKGAAVEAVTATGRVLMLNMTLANQRCSAV